MFCRLFHVTPKRPTRQCSLAVRIFNLETQVRRSVDFRIAENSAPGFGAALAGGSESLTGRVAKQINLCT
jgi:hypothetical protein